ncbi:MAG: hypothetical protein IKB57_02585 [Bacteroidaceae bacterium]|nr:hypothetical protein [Bacteroidaceae bacterium]
MKKMMKNFSRLVLVTFAALSISFAFTSCGGDDDGDDIYNNGAGVIDPEVSGGENADGTVSLTVNNGIYVAKWTLTFDNDLCTRAICECTFSSREFANAFVETCEDEVISRNGNKVTIDQTDLFEGDSKDDVLAAIEAMSQQY